MNEPARLECEGARWACFDQDRKLALLPADVNAKFRTTLQECAAAPRRFFLRLDKEGEPASRFLVIHPIMLSTPAPPVGATLDSAERYFLVKLRASDFNHGLSPAEIQAAFDLTPMESRLVSELVAGRSLRDIALDCDVKISTMRWHLANVREKTNTRSQVELVNLVLSIAT
jgi:DNA-binding CsgD family transcriptional regulator